MRNTYLTLLVVGLIIIGAIYYLQDPTVYPTKLDQLKEKYSAPHKKKAVDHSKFAVLQKKFKTPQDVTKACLSCHNESHKEIIGTPHFRWERPVYLEGRGVSYLGKHTVINNFCIGTQGSEVSCTKCHAGYGWHPTATAFDTVAADIDCLVCHDNSNTYIKGGNMGGYPAKSVDLNVVAQSVGRPTRDNCGVCHFFGGGGNNVKHGDLEKAMFHPSRDVDVHMADTGANLQCVDCHKTEHHNISGRDIAIEGQAAGHFSCAECHTTEPHASSILNEHTYKVACQTCHIPEYAKVNSVNIHWDWSTAGVLDKDGKPFMEEDSLGDHIYKSIKGSFTWGRHLKPQYFWFNGKVDHYVLGQKVPEGDTVVCLNQINGSYSDIRSKIYPMRIHTTKQPFDLGTRMIIQPKLASLKKGEGAYWKDFEWNKAAEVGMKSIGLPYSGKFGWINTTMYWPLDHMVSTKDKSLQCTDCHTDNGSRLAGLNDFYMPARDHYGIVDILGKLLIILTLLGVIGHGSLRYYFNKKNKS
jgi:octaheme c-type cytochrome (tetrathionate reductase family)